MSHSEPASALDWTSIQDWWVRICDPYLLTIPLFQSPFHYGSIFAFILILIASVSWTKKVSSLASNGKGSKDTSVLPRIDIRPLQLIHDGFLFGVYGVAIPLFLSVNEFGPMLFSCSNRIIENEYLESVTKHLIYTYLMISYVHYLRPILQAIGNVQIDVGIDILHHFLWSNLLIIFSAANPTGITLLIPVIDAIVKVFHYGTSVLLVAQNQEPIKSKVNELARFFGFAIIAIHSYYLASNHSTCRPPYSTSNNSLSKYQDFIFLPVAIYSAFVSFYSLLRFVSRSGVSASSIEKQVLSSGRSLRSSVKLTKLPVSLVK